MGTTPALHRHEARPPYIFRISNKCTAREGSEKRGIARRCSASFFNYVQPPLGRAALEEALALPPRLSATLRLLSRTRGSPPPPPPPPLPPFQPPPDPSRNPLTTSFHPFIRRSLLFLGRKKILIGSRDSLAARHLACLTLLLVIVIPFPPASRITLPARLLTREIDPSNVESTLDARDLRWHR